MGGSLGLGRLYALSVLGGKVWSDVQIQKHPRRLYIHIGRIVFSKNMKLYCNNWVSSYDWKYRLLPIVIISYIYNVCLCFCVYLEHIFRRKTLGSEMIDLYVVTDNMHSQMCVNGKAHLVLTEYLLFVTFHHRVITIMRYWLKASRELQFSVI